MPHPDFQPIPMFRTNVLDPATQIPEAEWTDHDRAALETVGRIFDEIESFRDNERSRQLKIGPSEIGMECDKCFMRKMAKRPKGSDNGSWKTQAGTYLHAGFEAEYRSRIGLLLRRFPEQKVLIDTYRGETLDGSCDLYVPPIEWPELDGFGMAVDWKFPSTDEDEKGKLKPSATMSAVAKGKLKRDYICQGNLYGRGWELRGLPVSHVVIFYIPTFGHLQHAKPVVMRYDPKWAAWGVARWRTALDEHAALVDTHISSDAAWDLLIEKAPKAHFCFSCKRYEKAEMDASPLKLLRGPIG